MIATTIVLVVSPSLNADGRNAYSIPARAGNTARLLVPPRGMPVHPLACGEH